MSGKCRKGLMRQQLGRQRVLRLKVCGALCSKRWYTRLAYRLIGSLWRNHWSLVLISLWLQALILVRGLKSGLLIWLTKFLLSLHRERRSRLGNSNWLNGRLLLGEWLLLSYVSWLWLARLKLAIFLLHGRPERDLGLVELLLLWLWLF